MIKNPARKVQHLLDKSDKKRFLILICQMILVALLEFTGIALVLPFIRFAGNQLTAEKFPSIISNWITSYDHRSFLILAGVMIFSLIVISTLMKIYLAWREQKFVWNLSHKLTVQQHKNILSQPYSFFIEKNSSEIISNLIVETSTTVRGILLPIAQIISNSVIAFLFLGLITFLHPKVSLILIVAGGVVGFIIVTLLKKKLIALGQKRLALERSRFLQLKESIIGIKTVKTNIKENFFLEKFSRVSENYSNIKPFVNTLNAVPRNALDIILFGGVILLVTLFIYRGDNLSLLLPTLTFYVLVGFKLMPTFQNIINSIIMIRFSWPSIKAVFEGLERKTNIKLGPEGDLLSFNDKIELHNCSFSHQTEKNILTNASLVIDKAQKVGIVGYSGSGKTTLVEILSGLLIPEEGYISVDGVRVTEGNIYGLMKLISFIPQEVFFFDDTMLRNISLEDDEENVDFDKLNDLLKIFKLESFIDNLPNGLHSRVGEFGVKISGGQKQRLGFARALYNEPQILILDESTSALDYLTEKELLENLRINMPELTIVKVAHRLKSVQDCDNIYFLDGGKIIAEGSFEEIVKSNELFREMVSAGTI